MYTKDPLLRPRTAPAWGKERTLRWTILVLLAVFALLAPTPAVSAPGGGGNGDQDSTQLQMDLGDASAPVIVDGEELFRVYGTRSFPSTDRAEGIAGRIRAAAARPDVTLESITVREIEGASAIFAGEERLAGVLQSDADLEGFNRVVLAQAIAERIKAAVVKYRNERKAEALGNAALQAILATLIVALLTLGTLALSRRIRRLLEAQLRQHVHSIEIQNLQIINAERLWKAALAALDSLLAGVALLVAVLYLQHVLRLFPWTRLLGNHLADFVLAPLGGLLHGTLAALPSMFVLLVIFLVVRYLLRLARVLFKALARGEVTVSWFEPEWADPTYNLVWTAGIIFGLVVAYPYIPGSNTGVFKGLSLFVGILVSLGSTSLIANIVAGYLLIYRRAFKVGDRVKIGNTLGDVTAVGVQATHLRTIKNEEVVVPNSMILNNEVINYTALARTEGLILSTTVGIGYETPWRQVEAMLLMAAERTPGALADPKPFILQRSLGDFAVNYELNVYVTEAHTMYQFWTDLHRHILDVFNEYGVQIMTPAYRGDTVEPKVVPRHQWYLAPARPGEGQGVEPPATPQASGPRSP